MCRKVSITIGIALLILMSTSAFADGFLLPVERPHSTIVVPDQLFTVRYHHVKVSIQDQLATTSVDQIFHNDTNIEREGIYVFPMPEGSAITKFSMYAGEEEIIGKIMTKEEARNIYQSIVRQRKDPAILEYIDRNTFRASVYPIPANGDKRIRLSYAEVTRKSGNAFRYVYPLSTERFSARPLEDCKVNINITSQHAITNVYSPTHPVNVDRRSDHEVIVSWQAKDTKPDTDLVLYYSVSNDDIGIDLIAHRQAGEKGFYMLLASPRAEIDKSKIQPKNVVFVLDRTGSMAGEKIEQVKLALKFCINSLKVEDRFNVITFNETPNLLFPEMRKPSADARRQATDAVDALDATGGTNIDDALASALKQFPKSGIVSNSYIIFLTDGQPTVGITDPETILKHVRSNNKSSVKVFVFGAGYDVNTHLLDKLAQQNKGDADFVRPRENIEEKVSSFFAKVSDPLLSDVTVSFSDGKIFDAYPSAEIPDIFIGSQLVILGRYSESGKTTIKLSGISNGKRKTFTLAAELPNTEGSNEFIPQLWAARKIGYLLDEIRLHNNQELVDEVVRLSKEYGIPTEFTSFLADDRKMAANAPAAAMEAKSLFKAAGGVDTGSYGVAQSKNAGGYKSSAQLPSAPVPADATQIVGQVAPNGRTGGVYYDKDDQAVVVANVQNIARRTFYQRDNVWEDADLKENQKCIKIKQFSDAHFKLMKADPRIAQYSTLGNVRIVLVSNQAIEIGPDGKDQLSDQELNALLKPVPPSAKNSRVPGALAYPLVVGLLGIAVLSVPLPSPRERR